MRIWVTVAVLGIGAACLGADLAVDSSPEGASVFVDDQFAGVTPVTVPGLAAGGHLVRLEKRGFAGWRGRVDVAGPQAHIAAELVPAAVGRIVVSSEPTGADVYLNGEWRGKTPLTIDHLAQGRHAVQVVLDGYDTFGAETDLTQQPSAEVSAQLGGRIEDYLVTAIAANPKAPNNYADLAHYYFLRRRFADAIATFARGFDMVAESGETLPPDEVKRLYNEALYTYQGEYDFGGSAALQEARPLIEQCFRDAMARHPECGQTAEWLGDLLLQAGRTPETVEVYHQGVRTATGEVALIGLRAKYGSQRYSEALKLHNGGRDQAIAVYKEIIAELPGHYTALDSRSQLATIYAEQNDYAAAVEQMRALADEAKRHPSIATYLTTLAGYQAHLGDYEAVARTYEEILTLRSKGDAAVAALNSLAAVYLDNLSAPDKARTCYQRLAELAKGTNAAATALQNVQSLLRAAGQTAEADAVVQRILTEYPLSPEAWSLETNLERQQANTASKAAYGEAAQLSSSGQYAAAVGRYWQVLDQYPDTYYGRAAGGQAIALLYGTIGDYPAAIAKRKEFIERFPDDESCPTHLYYMAASYSSHLADYRTAVELYEEMATKYPDSPLAPSALSNIGALYVDHLAEYQKGLDALLRVADQYPDSPYALSALYSAGNAYLCMYEVEKGRDVWRRLMRLAPNSTEAAQAAQCMTWTRRRAGHGQWGADGLGARAGPGPTEGR